VKGYVLHRPALACCSLLPLRLLVTDQGNADVRLISVEVRGSEYKCINVCNHCPTSKALPWCAIASSHGLSCIAVLLLLGDPRKHRESNSDSANQHVLDMQHDHTRTGHKQAAGCGRHPHHDSIIITSRHLMDRAAVPVRLPARPRAREHAGRVHAAYRTHQHVAHKILSEES
jgi:hypothetical protein